MFTLSKLKNILLKGCYGYPNGVFKGLVFYGLGGSEEDMQDQVTSMQGRIRPQGYDCNGIV